MKNNQADKDMIRMKTLLLAFLRFKDRYKNKSPDIDSRIDIMEAFLCNTYDLIEKQNKEEK